MTLHTSGSALAPCNPAPLKLRVPLSWTLAQLREALLPLLLSGMPVKGVAAAESLRVTGCGTELDVRVTLPRGIAFSSVRDLQAVLAAALGARGGSARRHYKLRFGGRYMSTPSASLESYGLTDGAVVEAEPAAAPPPGQDGAEGASHAADESL